jgi:hypothetical protein
MRLANKALSLVAVMGIAGLGIAQAQEVDYQVYKTKIEPIFLKKREGHARCVVCHAESTNSFSLQPYPPGTKVWTEEQSRKNFEMVSYLVVPGKPEQSRLATHPLAKEAGGEEYHSGGRQFRSKDDPDWKAIVEWIKNAK